MTKQKSIKIKSLDQFLQVVDEKWKEMTSENDEFWSDIWFRGHSVADWKLIPSALRPPFDGFSEHRLRQDFQLRSQPFLHEVSVKPNSPWEWYFLMQHYGVPTRLLDWSESALVALYFSLLPEPSGHDDSDGCVWVFNPRALNADNVLAGNFIPIYSNPNVAAYLPALWKEDVDLPTDPLALDPPFNSPRIAAQRGKFTIHGAHRVPLEGYTKLGKNLSKIIIPNQFKSNLRRQFLVTGIGEANLFPSVSGVAGEISRVYGNKW